MEQLNFDTPYTKLTEKIPDYKFLKICRCTCFLLLTLYNSYKLQAKSSKCVFLGYDNSHNGYRCLDLSSARLLIKLTFLFKCRLTNFLHKIPTPSTLNYQPPYSKIPSSITTTSPIHYFTRQSLSTSQKSYKICNLSSLKHLLLLPSRRTPLSQSQFHDFLPNPSTNTLLSQHSHSHNSLTLPTRCFLPPLPLISAHLPLISIVFLASQYTTFRTFIP